MKRYASITLTARVLLLTAIVLLAGNAKSWGQQSDIDPVKAAIAAYHAAIGTLDIAKMEPLWAHDSGVMLINPRDKSVSVGWDAVKTNWERTFNVWSELKAAQAQGPYIRVHGDVAWSTGIAIATGKTKAGSTVNAGTFETDVFEKRGGRWLLVSHTALRVPQ